MNIYMTKLININTERIGELETIAQEYGLSEKNLYLIKGTFLNKCRCDCDYEILRFQTAYINLVNDYVKRRMREIAEENDDT
jgi:AraC-like DNA-binding protein